MSTILIVEDNPINTKLTSVLLRRAGYEVLAAVDGPAALAVLHEQQPALILMDIQLPGIRGLDVTRQIRANPLTAHIPVIALTAYAMAGDNQKAFNAGCNGYISKPFESYALLGLIAEHLPEAVEGSAVVPSAEATDLLEEGGR
jgi:two-component system, cell cycle response regulator DivK